MNGKGLAVYILWLFSFVNSNAQKLEVTDDNGVFIGSAKYTPSFVPFNDTTSLGLVKNMAELRERNAWNLPACLLKNDRLYFNWFAALEIKEAAKTYGYFYPTLEDFTKFKCTGTDSYWLVDSVFRLKNELFFVAQKRSDGKWAKIESPMNDLHEVLVLPSTDYYFENYFKLNPKLSGVYDSLSLDAREKARQLRQSLTLFFKNNSSRFMDVRESYTLSCSAFVKFTSKEPSVQIENRSGSALAAGILGDDIERIVNDWAKKNYPYALDDKKSTKYRLNASIQTTIKVQSVIENTSTLENRSYSKEKFEETFNKNSAQVLYSRVGLPARARCNFNTQNLTMSQDGKELLKESQAIFSGVKLPNNYALYPAAALWFANGLHYASNYRDSRKVKVTKFMYVGGLSGAGLFVLIRNVAYKRFLRNPYEYDRAYNIANFSNKAKTIGIAMWGISIPLDGIFAAVHVRQVKKSVNKVNKSLIAY
jgi:hypothetical protein